MKMLHDLFTFRKATEGNFEHPEEWSGDADRTYRHMTFLPCSVDDDLEFGPLSKQFKGYEASVRPLSVMLQGELGLEEAKIAAILEECGEERVCFFERITRATDEVKQMLAPGIYISKKGMTMKLFLLASVWASPEVLKEWSGIPMFAHKATIKGIIGYLNQRELERRKKSFQLNKNKLSEPETTRSTGHTVIYYCGPKTPEPQREGWKVIEE